MNDTGMVPIRGESDIVAVRKAARELAGRAGFGRTDSTRIVTCVSELGRNVWDHAGGGEFTFRLITGEKKKGVEFTFMDKGPGIEDVELALTPGYKGKDSKGLGLGLWGAKRLMDELEIQTQVGRGTTITTRKWCRSHR